MSKVIAVVDDEPDILELVAIHLKKASFQVKEFHTSQAFLNSLKSYVPDAVVLDLMLPDGDGLDVCKMLKKDDNYSKMPIIMLTAKGEETDKVLGLELGADDYITKPFSPRELVARIKAVLRRGQAVGESQKIIIDGIMIDPQRYEVTVNHKKIELTSTEFRILSILAEKKGRVYTRSQFLDKLWGSEKAVTDRTIDVHIKNLREKLGREGNRIKKHARNRL